MNTGKLFQIVAVLGENCQQKVAFFVYTARKPQVAKLQNSVIALNIKLAH